MPGSGKKPVKSRTIEELDAQSKRLREESEKLTKRAQELEKQIMQIRSGQKK